MKTRGLVDFYLPGRWAYHFKILLASILITIVFKIILNDGVLWDAGLPVMLIILIIQLELFIWLGNKFFNIKKERSVKDYAKAVIVRLLLFFSIALIASVIIITLVTGVFMVANGTPLSQIPKQLLEIESKGFLVGASIGCSFGAILFFYFAWIDSLRRERKLIEEKLIFQYETLKNQVNPHFLFNSLNTLSSLVSKDPILSEEYINKLSGIYRYILENKDKEVVSLGKEMAFARDYFYLQKIRDNGKIKLDIKSENEERYEVLPISVQILMENALKHNIATRKTPLEISLYLDAERDRIIMTNNFNPKTLIETTSKIGLKNLSERIKLITGEEVLAIRKGRKFHVEIPLIKKNA